MSSLPFDQAMTWRSRVLEADNIWQQVKAILESENIAMPKTPRRPDVRMILNNVSGRDLLFRNPGDHANKAEHIPPQGDKTAAMVMVKGDTLKEQFENAATLAKRYGLDKEGLSLSFVDALTSGEALDLVAEAYGPAPFEGQAEKLVEVNWQNADGTAEDINPVKNSVCAYGARAATDETAFLTELVIFVQGTGTTPELVEGPGMVIAVSEDWETKAETTRPIVPSVAKTFYGRHYNSIPVVSVDHEGLVKSIDLRDGRILSLAPIAYQLERRVA